MCWSAYTFLVAGIVVRHSADKDRDGIAQHIRKREEKILLLMVKRMVVYW